MSISYLPENAVVKLRFYSKSNNYKPAFQQIKIDLKKILGNAIFGYGDISFESFLIELLIKHRITISVAESLYGWLHLKINDLLFRRFNCFLREG